jgi:hypothetical protein
MSARHAKHAPRWSGERVVVVSVAVGIVGTLPLALYVAFGPKDGNPIGLGLLFIVSVPAAIIGASVGAIRMALRRLLDRDAN